MFSNRVDSQVAELIVFMYVSKKICSYNRDNFNNKCTKNRTRNTHAKQIIIV